MKFRMIAQVTLAFLALWGACYLLMQLGEGHWAVLPIAITLTGLILTVAMNIMSELEI